MAARGQKQSPFPKFYDFPPFFTIQPVQQTRQKQLSIWAEFVKDYQKAQKSTSIDVAKAAASSGPPFGNAKINRKLNDEGIRLVLDELCRQGYGAWDDVKSKRVCRTTERKFEEWGNILLKWAKENGQMDRLCTLDEIRTENSGEEFHNLEAEILFEALKLLEANGKSTLIAGESLDELGVKLHER
ncbi:hypothetical protein AAMO2058_000108600 [Amorphochlora amoebiformis]